MFSTKGMMKASQEIRFGDCGRRDWRDHNRKIHGLDSRTTREIQEYGTQNFGVSLFDELGREAPFGPRWHGPTIRLKASGNAPVGCILPRAEFMAATAAAVFPSLSLENRLYLQGIPKHLSVQLRQL